MNKESNIFITSLLETYTPYPTEYVRSLSDKAKNAPAAEKQIVTRVQRFKTYVTRGLKNILNKTENIFK